VNAALRLCYRYVPSFKHESRGLYSLYAAAYSRTYAKRMRRLHRRGRHAAQRGLDPRCSWCGADTAR